MINHVKFGCTAGLILGLAFVSACGSKSKGQVSNQVGSDEEWNELNDPLLLSGNYNRTLKSLPTDAKLEEVPWTDTYWPSYEAGLANRWNQSGSDPFKYQMPSKTELKSMNLEALKELSPAEKFDIFRGRYDFPLVKSERSRTSPESPSWEGLCHGWAPAAYLYKEPGTVVLENEDGIKVPFGSSDVKSLLTYYTGQVARAKVGFLGSRCDEDIIRNKEAAKTPECSDTNAGSFHVVLTNQIGLMKKSFVADVTRDAEVWNQPVYGYVTEVREERAPHAQAAPGTVKEVKVMTQMKYTLEVQPTWQPLNGTEGFGSTAKMYEYWLELNRKGEIIGGSWISEDRPDFLWIQGATPFSGDFSKLDSVYKSSLVR